MKVLASAPRLRSLLVLAAALLAGALACKKATPVAPAGSALTLSANPSRISSASGVSTITAIVTRMGGSPVNPGTEVFFNTTLGTIDTLATTDGAGVARATLRGDGRVGKATVTASSGALTPGTLDVQIGGLPASITLQAVPSTVSTSGGTIQLLALVRDDQGLPLAGALLNFSSPFGTLGHGGGFQTTDSSGTVTDVLTLTPSDVTAISGTTFQVSVTGSGTGTGATQNFTITVLRLVASFTSTAGGNLTVAFKDTSTPTPTQWAWDFGDGHTSSAQNPVHQYAAAGTFVVTLTVTSPIGTATTNGVVTVSATTTG